MKCLSAPTWSNYAEGGLPAVKAGELMHSAIDRLGLSGSTGFEWVRGSMGSILRTVTEVNKTLQDGDWDADPAKEREVRSLIALSDFNLAFLLH